MHGSAGGTCTCHMRMRMYMRVHLRMHTCARTSPRAHAPCAPVHMHPCTPGTAGRPARTPLRVTGQPEHLTREHVGEVLGRLLRAQRVDDDRVEARGGEGLAQPDRVKPGQPRDGGGTPAPSSSSSSSSSAAAAADAAGEAASSSFICIARHL